MNIVMMMMTTVLKMMIDIVRCRGIYYWLTSSSTFLPSFAHLLVENTTTTTTTTTAAAPIFLLGVDTTRKWRWCEVGGSTDKCLLVIYAVCGL